jgi:1-deoxy-D-xylulose-5-phosphate synthase
MRFVKPLDRALLLELARSHDGFVTIEDNVVAGGAGSGVAELLNAEGVLRPLLHLGLPDAFQHHASREQLLAEAGIDAAGIRAAILARWPQLATGADAARTAAG